MREEMSTEGFRRVHGVLESDCELRHACQFVWNNSSLTG